MVWTMPLTAVDGAEFTAAQFNASVRDNLNETAVGKATTAGSIFAGQGPNSIAERVPTTDVILTSETTGSTSYTNLATIGPTVLNLTTGPKALVLISTFTSNNTANDETCMGVVISNATTVAANDQESLQLTSATTNAQVACSWAWIYPLTAGQNTFRPQYRVTGGTGTWSSRRIAVIPF